MFEKKLRLDALYAFYGKMLTDKQNEIMSLYCMMDYSLGEISEILSVSRQAVHDTIKRTEKILENFESQLGLYQKFEDKQNRFEELDHLLSTFEDSGDHELLEKMKKIIKLEIE